MQDLKEAIEYTPFEFRGNSKEYFKIWIVNIALTLFSVGIYSAWAKVRVNRYLYSNTFLNGSNFEYNANPKRILYGRVIVVAFYALFLIATDILYNPTLATIVLIIFLIALPWLIRQAISFKLKSTSYRNIYFRYKGRVREFYTLFFLFLTTFALTFSPLLLYGIYRFNKELIISLETLFILLFFLIAIPIFYKKFKELMINNSYYGKTKFNFLGTKRGSILVFLKIWLLNFAILVAIGVFIGVLGATLDIDLKNLDNNQTTQLIISLVITSIYILFLAFYRGVMDGYLSNYIANNTTLQDCPFKADINPLKLGIISATNMGLVILSFGLLHPYSKIRYIKYKLEHTYFKCENFDKFLADEVEQTTTIGEEAIDFFDIDIGI